MSSNGVQQVKLSEIADVRDGTHDSPKESKIGKPLVTSKNIKNGKIDLNNTYLISIEDFQNINRRSKVDKWDILFSMIGTIGEMSIVDFEPDFAIKNVGLFKTNDPEISNWIYYYLKSPEAQNEIKATLKGSTQQYISLTDLRNFPIALPLKNKRFKITEILSNLDGKIENNLATNQILEEITRTLFKEWFVNFNYPNADGNLKHSEFGEIPECWSINCIGEICYVQNGYAFRSKDFQEQGEVGIIKIKNISGNVVDIKNTDFVDASVVSSLDKKFKIESGSLLIAMTGAEVGKIGLVPMTEKNLWLNQRVGMFQKKIAYGNLFMYLLLSTDTYQAAIQNSALGSAQPNISASAIESIRAIIPPTELVEAFGKIVKPMFEKILDNLAENETLKNTRDSLLPKLMSGEIQVNG
jgi:type I restriction enzyme, S subunit